MKTFINIIFSFLVFIFSLNISTIAQMHRMSSKTEYKPLRVGDRVPDLKFINLINYPNKTAKLSSFKDKLIILEIWNTYCASCIGAWPKLMGLQKEFAGKIQIILINTRQDTKIVRELIKERNKIHNINITLPADCKDTIWDHVFPHSTVPHVVWIDRNGFVKSITVGSTVNSRFITAILNGDSITIPPKIENDKLIKPDFKKPLFVNGNGGSVDKVYWQSILTKRPAYLRSGMGLVANEKFGYYAGCIGCAIKDLYELAYGNTYDEYGFKEMLYDSRVILHVRDSAKYVSRINGEPQYDNLYAYHLIAPPTTGEIMQEMMQSDLNRYFGLNVKWEKSKIKCLILTAEDSSLICYKNGEYTFSIMPEGGSVELNKVYISSFVHFLERSTNYYFSPYPIIDETNFRGMIGGIKFDVNVNDYNQLDLALEKYKMHFKLEERDIDMLVIKDKSDLSVK